MDNGQEESLGILNHLRMIVPHPPVHHNHAPRPLLAPTGPVMRPLLIIIELFGIMKNIFF